ncbi:hypothetical protein Pcinc_003750 [Petrolisthes cinctipes]|uniref:Uncharacterized protein n=1 Tax=Petrolisthes cinctipes TaxID=88211 RepID=A0AAE1GGQ6_PETCI|nr:hypothetical protein Pcinc_003750 [Petrolisthes cinctipes]
MCIFKFVSSLVINICELRSWLIVSDVCLYRHAERLKQIAPSRIVNVSSLFHTLDSELGAQTNIYLAVSEEVEGVSGRYFTDCKEVKTSKLARDKDLAKRLWEVSEKAVKLRLEEKLC